jgi:SAM-dependent methyltransferase
MNFLFICFVVFIVGLELYWIVRCMEYARCSYYKKQVPFVASDRTLRRAVVAEIVKRYPGAKNICEIGSGYGGLARAIARRTGAKVVALENMPFTYFVARMGDLFTFARNVETIKCDAFEYLKNYDGEFDVAVAYMGPGINDRLAPYMDKFKVLILLDVSMADGGADIVVDLKHGFTRYGHLKYPHKLFIYENKK